MNKLNKNTIERCKHYIDNTDFETIYKKYYYGKNGRNKVLVRDDAEEFTTDWVNTMDNFINNIHLVISTNFDGYYSRELVDVHYKTNNNEYIFSFHYKSLIPIELYEHYNRPSYEPRKFIYESNNELLKETLVSDNNEYLKREIEMYNIEPELNVWIGDKFKLKDIAVNYIQNDNWLRNNHVGYDDPLINFIEYCVENDITLKCIGKFKGQFTSDYPWWSLVEHNINIFNSINRNKFYILDLLIKDNSKPSYEPRKFVYESHKLQYYNDIENQKTQYKYRYKTEEEFKRDFGDVNWRNNVRLSWIIDMDYLFGKNVQSNDLNLSGDVIFSEGSWDISKDMVTKNKLASPTYQPKKFVYESFNIEKFNTKLLKESIRDFENDYDKKPEDSVEEFLKYYDDLYEKLNKNNTHFINNKLKKEKPLKENIDEYNRRIRDLDINTIILNGKIYDEKLKKELIELLIKIGVTNSISSIQRWDSNNENNENTAFVITLNNCVNSTLSKNYIYTSSIDFIESGDLIRFYTELNPTNIMIVSEVINFIKNKIIFQNAVNMYKPKKFIYESNEWYPYRFKTKDEMIKDYGLSWKDGDYFESGWNEEMDHLLGKPYPYHENEIRHGGARPRRERMRDSNGQTWTIDWNMLTKNKPNAINMYKPKKFVYENIKKLRDF